MHSYSRYCTERWISRVRSSNRQLDFVEQRFGQSAGVHVKNATAFAHTEAGHSTNEAVSDHAVGLTVRIRGVHRQYIDVVIGEFVCK